MSPVTASARAPGASVSVISGGSDSSCVVLMFGRSRVHIAAADVEFFNGTRQKRAFARDLCFA
jgi:hypothetical protein